jgi:hypothetical protein
MAKVALLLLAFHIAAPAPPDADQVIFGALRSTDSSLRNFKVLRRVAAGDNDVVLAIGEPTWSTPPAPEYQFRNWGSLQKLGIFVQEQAPPRRVFTIAIAPGPEECDLEILRVTATDTVLSCDVEKGVGPNQKFVYDVRAKRLVNHFTYDRVVPYRATSRDAAAKPGAVSLWAANESTHVVIEYRPGVASPFRLLAAREPNPKAPSTSLMTIRAGLDDPPQTLVASPPFGPGKNYLAVATRAGGGYGVVAVEERRGNRSLLHRLPSTTYEEFALARPEEVSSGHTRESTGLHELIGAWQIEGDRLWFGKDFYDGEGEAGVGGFGYFDPATNRYRLFPTPLIINYSVAAIHVEPTAVWLALVGHYEYGNAGAGVLRFDRATETFQQIDIGRGVGFRFMRVGGELVLATDVGISMLNGLEATRYFIDKTSDGRLRVAQVDR